MKKNKRQDSLSGTAAPHPELPSAEDKRARDKQARDRQSRELEDTGRIAEASSIADDIKQIRSEEQPLDASHPSNTAEAEAVDCLDLIARVRATNPDCMADFLSDSGLPRELSESDHPQLGRFENLRLLG